MNGIFAIFAQLSPKWSESLNRSFTFYLSRFVLQLFYVRMPAYGINVFNIVSIHARSPTMFASGTFASGFSANHDQDINLNPRGISVFWWLYINLFSLVGVGQISQM